MKHTVKKELVKFLWKFLTALLAAAGGAASAVGQPSMYDMLSAQAGSIFRSLFGLRPSFVATQQNMRAFLHSLLQNLAFRSVFTTFAFV